MRRISLLSLALGLAVRPWLGPMILLLLVAVRDPQSSLVAGFGQLRRGL
jgi:hypothetical protein